MLKYKAHICLDAPLSQRPQVFCLVDYWLLPHSLKFCFVGVADYSEQKVLRELALKARFSQNKKFFVSSP